MNQPQIYYYIFCSETERNKLHKSCKTSRLKDIW